MKPVFTRVSNYLLRFTQTQMAITLISLPILVGWGLGFSFMSIVGNLVFAPLLTVFLTLSSLLLLTEVFGIPNQIIAYSLSILSNLWNYLLSFGSSSWIMECAKPPAWFLIGIPIVTWIALHHRKVKTTSRRMIVMSLLLLACYATFSLQKHHNATTSPVV